MAAARPARNAVNQRIHIATTPDGVQLAWARSGRGPTLVKASNWMTTPGKAFCASVTNSSTSAS